MKAIVKSNWPNAKKGDLVEVTERQLSCYPNHLEAAPESLKVVVDAQVDVIAEPILNGSDLEIKLTRKYSREDLEEIAKDGIKPLRKVADKFGVKGRGIDELINEILEAQG